MQLDTTTVGERCDRCSRSLDAAEIQMAWPVAMEDGYICPSCYGDEAYCVQGHLLRGDAGWSECEVCNAN